MKKNLLFLFAICLFVLTALEASAQPPPNAPPKVLSIFREDVKASRGAAHADLETGYVRALQKAGWPTYSLAISAIAGPNDAWFITAYESYAAMEKDRMAMDKNADLMKEFERLDSLDAEFRTNQRGILAVLDEGLSYNPGVNIPQMRYFVVNTVRVRPGHDEEYAEARKILLEALKKANLDQHSSVYRVTAGMPNGTYLIFTPRKSLSEMDPNPEMAKALQAAMGDENRKKRLKLLSDSVITSEVSIYAFSPKMSYVSKEFAKAGGEDFWSPKEMVAMKPPPKKNGLKATAKKQP
jgi:hypothetical protein